MRFCCKTMFVLLVAFPLTAAAEVSDISAFRLRSVRNQLTWDGFEIHSQQFVVVCRQAILPSILLLEVLIGIENLFFAWGCCVGTEYGCGMMLLFLFTALTSSISCIEGTSDLISALIESPREIISSRVLFTDFGAFKEDRRINSNIYVMRALFEKYHEQIYHQNQSSIILHQVHYLKG